ncbi:MAG: hypothetical protein ACSHX6_09440 [Akkermansiaceae bacterium]
MSKIPDHKHSDKELSRLRAQSAMQASNSPIVETYNKKLAHKFTIVVGYVLPLVAPFWLLVKKIAKDTDYGMSDFYIMAIPIILALMIALWIAIKRVLSRHNSAFILILSMLCGFAIISAVNSSSRLKYNLMSTVGKDAPLPDPLLESEEEEVKDAGNKADVMTDADREELKAAEEEMREWLREKAQREKEDTAQKALEAAEAVKP